MQKQLTYDLPTRVFHFLFSALFVSAFLITKIIDDENPIFSYHMLSGLLLGGLVLLRVIWGFIGTRFARFSSFALRPIELINYLKGILSGSKRKWAGHNPASSWGTLIMLSCAALLALSGILMTSGYKKTFEDTHEVLANIFLVTVLLHIAGVILHSLRHQDGIAMVMINGKKLQEDFHDKAIVQKPFVALILVLAVLLFAGILIKNYDLTTQKLNLFGKTLMLGDTKDSKKAHHDKHKKNHDDD